MQIDAQFFSDASGVCAIVMLGVHVVIYANKEGKKEQRLLAVEEKVKSIPSIELTLATVTATMAGLEGKIDSVKSDIRGDIQDLRNHLLNR